MRCARHLVLFVKEPRIGRVKTRLARDVGAGAALAFYRATVAEMVRRLGGDRRWRFWLAVAPDRARLPGLVRRGRARLIGQGPGDLGRRMARAFAGLPPGPAAIVGSDVPELTAASVWRAFRALRRHDAVFGPAADGGYWLVGLRARRAAAKLFRGVRWGSAHALADTLGNAEPAWSVAMLETLADVDDGAALARWRRRRRLEACPRRGRRRAAG